MFSLTDAMEKYKAQPKYREFVTWLADLVLSGGISGNDLICAAILAADLAENARRKIPGSDIKPATMPDGSPKYQEVTGIKLMKEKG